VADVRRLDAELEDRVRVPVIVPPTDHDPPEVQRCYDLGRSSYVTRPVEYARFVEAIRKRGSFPSIVQAPATPPARRS
jgi:DNA-binding NarL/FixJ family response regulator